MRKIRFFVYNDVAALLTIKSNEINKLIKTINTNNINPYYIYAYSIFESTISEILRYYLYAFPKKIADKININKNQLL